MKEIIFLNGKFLKAKEASISIDNPGFLLGLGLFETFRSYNKRIIYLDEHLKRIMNSCKLIHLKFTYTLGRLKKIIKNTVAINAVSDAYVRLTLWKSQSGTDILVIVRKYSPYSLEKYKRGFTANIAAFRQNEHSLFSQIKTTNRLFYELCLCKAKNQGFDEALIINNNGYIAEASRSNIFLVKNNEIFTPYLDCGCLDGITRRVIFDLAKKYHTNAQEGNFTLQDVYNADEAFLTNSLMGVMPLVSVEKHNIGKGRKGRLTEFFEKKYNLLLKHGY
jgi:branched-subunit amino acid aminotransferase/4-amino-4-deoxychorismate lyase